MATPSDQPESRSKSPVARFRESLPQSREAKVRRHRAAAIGAVGAVAAAVVGIGQGISSLNGMHNNEENPNVRTVPGVDNDPSNAGDAEQDSDALRSFEGTLIKVDVDGSGDPDKAVYVEVLQGGQQKFVTATGVQRGDAVQARVVDTKDGRYTLAGLMIEQDSTMILGADAPSGARLFQQPLSLPLKSGPATATVFLIDKQSGKKLQGSSEVRVTDAKQTLVSFAQDKNRRFIVTTQNQLADNALVLRVVGDADMKDFRLKINNTPVVADKLSEDMGSATFRIQNGATLAQNTSFTITANSNDKSIAPGGTVQSTDFQVDRSLTPASGASINSMAATQGSTSPTNIPQVSDGGFGL